MIRAMNDRFAVLYPQHLETVKQRHDKALAETGYDHIIIFGGEIHIQFLDDTYYPFKVNPHFKAWLPVVDNPHCFIVYTPGEKPRLVYYQPVDYWYKPASAPSGYWTGHFDIRVIDSPEKAKEHFPKDGRSAFVGEANEVAQTLLSAGDANPEALLNALHFERSWKTDYEIACLTEANVRGVRGHRAAAKAFREGKSEFEIHIDFLLHSSQAEEELPYGNIVALNENASVLHYLNHIREQPGDLRYSFLIDAGAQHHGYASDITRTYARDEQGEFAKMIAAMDAMQQRLCTMAKPGINYIDIHMAAHKEVATILHDFDFVHGLDADAIVEKRISSTFFPHGVGHFLGLQVHDVAGFHQDRAGCIIAKPEGHPYLRLTRIIDPRMVFTVEPGLYFIESLLADLQKTENAKYVNWTKVDEFRKFGGIRIEDDIVVTNDGHVNLTREAFAS
jgi:Xaa-Pro dipeptidase